jgi:hypothetical protein
MHRFNLACVHDVEAVHQGAIACHLEDASFAQMRSSGDIAWRIAIKDQV